MPLLDEHWWYGAIADHLNIPKLPVITIQKKTHCHCVFELISSNDSHMVDGVWQGANIWSNKKLRSLVSSMLSIFASIAYIEVTLYSISICITHFICNCHSQLSALAFIPHRKIFFTVFFKRLCVDRFLRCMLYVRPCANTQANSHTRNEMKYEMKTNFHFFFEINRIPPTVDSIYLQFNQSNPILAAYRY